MTPKTLATAALLALALSTAAAPASAFCGFYVSGAEASLFNDATVVVLMRDGQRTVLSMQNDYKGPPESFAMVIPVPVVLQKENVKTLPRAIFERIDKLSAPRLVEYWEQDPCAPPLFEGGGLGLTGVGMGGGGAGSGIGLGSRGVKVEAQFDVGEYEIVILSAKDSSGLDAWLRENHYKIPTGAEPYLRPYVQKGSKFFVAKVNAARVRFEGGRAALSPLRFHYDSDTFNLPVRLGLINSSGTQDLIVNVLARNQRYEVANYPNVTIPTNLDVAPAARDQFGAMYAALFDKTLAQTPRAVVTEYAWASGTCDPCPTGAVTARELMTLGEDVLPRTEDPARSRGGSFVLTRLHARYSKEALGEDLVFRAAPAIVGGREAFGGPSPRGAQPGPNNNFQARYVIRHPWTGPIACKEPKRGVWGGPPGGAAGPLGPSGGGVSAASKVAFAPRGAGFNLAAFVREDVPALGLKADLAAAALLAAPEADAGATRDAAPEPDAGASPAASAPAPSASADLPPPGAQKTGGKCGCDVVGSGAAGGGALLGGALAAALAWARSRRRR